MAISASTTAASSTRPSHWELYVLNLVRCCQALVYILLAVGMLHLKWLAPVDPMLARILPPAYLAFSVYMLLTTRWWLGHHRAAACIGLTLDVIATTIVCHAMPEVYLGVTLMLVINLGIGAILLPLRISLLFAASAAIATTPILWNIDHVARAPRLLESSLVGLVFLAATGLSNVLARQLRNIASLAKQRGLDLANMAQVNELVLQHMKTGVIVVDGEGRIHQMNEAARTLLGNPDRHCTQLRDIAPELVERLTQWQSARTQDDTPLEMTGNIPDTIPHFTRLADAGDRDTVIFLDDALVFSRQVEQITLASLGRLSAAIAHEIRNPLTAIGYASQLLSESPDLPASDARLANIITNHCRRMDQIVKNVLELSRQKLSHGQVLDLSAWADQFVDEYVGINDLGAGSLTPARTDLPVLAVADPEQLRQVIWNLVQNALRYGHFPGKPAHVIVRTRMHESGSVSLIEIIDHGPGIPSAEARHIFDAFYTTHRTGTGLGLYLARQMCAANGGRLEYVRSADGGSCFRVSLAAPPEQVTTPQPTH